TSFTGMTSGVSHFISAAAREPDLLATRLFSPRIHARAKLHLQVTACDGGSDARRRATERLVAECAQDFDYGRPPLLGAELIRHSADDHQLILAVHHLVADGASLPVLLGELAALYRGTRPVPDLPVQYVDFAAWQRARLQGTFREKLLAFWRRQ